MGRITGNNFKDKIDFMNGKKVPTYNTVPIYILFSDVCLHVILAPENIPVEH